MNPPLARPGNLIDAANDGLVYGYLFEAGLAGRPVMTMEEAASRLSSDLSGSTGGFLWLHLNLSHADTLPWLRTHAALSENFFESLVDGSRSARIEHDEGSLFAVLNDVTFDFTFDAKEVETLWISVRQDLVISVRRRPLRAVDRLRMAVKRGLALDSSLDLLDHLLRDQADELQRILRQASERLDEIEDALLAGFHTRHGAELAGLRRLMVRLQRLLTPEPAALARVLSRPLAWVTPEGQQQLGRAHEEFNLVLRDIAAIQDRIKLMQDETATKVNEQNNRSLFVLTIVTVLALPINLISGLFGMNVSRIPWSDETDNGFAIVVGLIVGITSVLAWVVIRRIGRSAGDDRD